MSETFTIAFNSSELVEILIMAFLGFALSMVITPLYTKLAFDGKWWKKPRSNAVTGEKSTVFLKLHGEKHKRHIPTMAGIIFLVSVTLVTVMFNLARDETWLPLAAFVGAGLVGLLDDIINIRGTGAGVAGLPSKFKFWLITLIALIGGLYFYYKLDFHSVSIPFAGNWELGWLIIPLFVIAVISTANAVNITDGLDGLAGGLVAIAFANYALISFLQERYGLAGFCMTIVGVLMSYTWFNIHPARFFMGDVGSFCLGTSLGVVAMLTDTVFILPIIGAIFVAEAGSSVIQILSKKLRHGKKVFKIAPIHHHFEALGWPETKVTMRFWVLGQVCGFIGIVVFLLGSYNA